MLRVPGTRISIVVLLTAALSVGNAAAFAGQPSESQEAMADPAPEFLRPGDGPASSTVSPAATNAAKPRPAKPVAATEQPSPRWETHAESRRTKAEAADLARRSGKRVLVTGDVAADTTPFLNPDGSTTLEITSGPSRIRRGDGWQDVDPTFVRRGDRFAAAAIVGDLSLTAGGTRELLTLGDGRHELSLAWSDELPEPRVTGATATYPDVLPDGDLVVRALRYGFEHSVVLRERPASGLTYDLALRLPRGQSARQAGRHVELTGADGTVVGRMPQALMFDARRDARTGLPLRYVPVSTRLVETTDGLAVRYAPSAEFLGDPDTVYPVTVDPTVSLTVSSDTDVLSSSPDSAFSGNTYLRVGTSNGGYSIGRSYLTFNTSSFAKANISAATLSVHQMTATTCTPTTMHVHRATSVSNSATTWNNKPGYVVDPSDPAPAFALGATGCPAARYSVDVKNLFQTIASIGAASSAIMLKADDEYSNASFKMLGSGNDGTRYPTLSVTYFANTTPEVSSLSPQDGAVLDDLTPTLSGMPYDPDGGTVTGYFYVKNSAGAWVTNGAQVTGPADQRLRYTVEDGKLRAGETYTWYMRVCDVVGACSAMTTPRTVTPRLGVPAICEAAWADSGDRWVKLWWDPPAYDGGAAVTSYEWTLYHEHDGSVVTNGTVLASQREVTYTQARNGYRYYWRVAAVNQYGAGESRRTGTVIASTTPSAPTNLAATAGDASSTATWQASADDGGDGPPFYTAKLFRKSDPATAVYTVSMAGTLGAPYTATATGLTNGTTYFWTVTAWNGRGNGGTATSGDVVPATVPSAPRDVQATEQQRPEDVVLDTANPPATARVTVSWQAPADNGGAAVGEYLVQAYEMPSGNPVLQSPVSACGSCYSAQVSGLKPDRRYVFGVVARNRAGSGAEGRSPELLTHLPAQVTKTVTDAPRSVVVDPATGRRVAGRGDTLRFTVTVTNPQSQPADVQSVVDTLPAGIEPGNVTVDGQPCGSACSRTGNTLTLAGGYQLAAGQTRTYSYVAVLTASERACVVNAVNKAVARGPFGLDEGAVGVTTCGSGLGMEPWWSYLSQEVAAQSVASVNVANGNLVVQATDGTPVQARGRLAYVLRRTYNSQDVTGASLPGSFGAGWTLNLGHASELATGGVAPTALHVPRVGDLLAGLTDPLAVTLVDRDGTRHVFAPKALPAVSVGGLSGPAGVLTPSALTAPAGKQLCVDLAYQAPAGVHLGLWRYVAVGTGSANPCANVAANDPVVVGYAAMRPDRVRTEFDVAGRLLELRDGAGVALRYEYEADPQVPGSQRLARMYEPRSCTPDGTETSPCRWFKIEYGTDTITVRDPAGRRTRYEFGTPSVAGLPAGVKVLRRVVNPPETAGGGTDAVTYSYEGDSDPAYGPTSCDGSALQLCSVTDAEGVRTEFRYDTSGSGAAGLSAIGRVVRTTDRIGTVTTVAYPSSDRTVAVRGGTQQRAFTGIDAHGRAGGLVEGTPGDVTDPAYAALRATTFTWDGATSCAQPAGSRDNNLCRRVRAGSANTGSSGIRTPDEDASWLYNEQGLVLRERRVHAGATGTPSDRDTTFGYRTQYFGSDSAGNRSTVVATDAVAGNGTVTATRPSALSGRTALYAVSDRVESLPPTGNAPGAAVHRHRVEWVVDADPARTPGAVPASGACPEVTTGTSNTGLVCAETVPYGAAVAEATTAATTAFGYDAFGQKTRKRTPRGGLYTYLYHLDSDRDLSGLTSAGGRLKAVTDPLDAFVAFGHDRAGNVVRTWDRDATARSGVGSASLFEPGAGVAGYAETRYAAGTFAEAARSPWRYPRLQQTPAGATTRLEVDRHGNVTRLVPPRGAGAVTSPYDTVTEYDPDGRPESVRRGGDPARTYRYDAFGNLEVETDPSGTPTLYRYDAVNRRTERVTLRGMFPADPADAPAACRKTAAADPAFGADRLVCTETTAYDTVDNVVATVDRDGQRTVTGYDSLRRRTAVLVPRGGGVTLRSEWVYDADGRVVVACSPRQFPGGVGRCDESSVHAVHTAYDVAGRVVTTKTYRDDNVPLTTRTTYDADGNPVAIAAPRQVTEPGTDHTVNQTFDLAGRRTAADQPRAGRTAYVYTPSGDVRAVVAPGAPGDNVGQGGAGRAVRVTGYSYDADHRVVDVVEALQVPVADPAGDPVALKTAIDSASTDEAAQTNIRTRTAYDAHGNVVATFAPRAFAGVPVNAPDPRFMLRTEYDANDRPVKQFAPRAESQATDATGDETQRAHCPATTDPADLPLGYPGGTLVCVSTISYDADGRAAEVGLPAASGDNRRLVYKYTEDGLVRETHAPDPAVDDALVRVSAVLHDGSGRAVRTTNALGHVTLTTYTADGLVSRVRRPGGPGGLIHETGYQYDENGNRTAEITPRPTAGDKPSTVTTYYADNRVRAVYAGGDDGARGPIQTSYVYDANGNATEVMSPSANARDLNNLGGVPTRHTYTPDDLVLTTTQPVVVTALGATQSRVTTYGYDDAGRKTSVDIDLTGTPAADGAPQAFSYYPTGLLRAETGRGGTDTVSRRYDAGGALVEATMSRGGTSRTTTVGYYLDGLVRDTTSDGRVTAYAYDGSGARSALGEGTAGGPLDVTRYDLNDASLPESMTSGDSGPINWSYNSLGQPLAEHRGDRTQVWSYRSDDLLDRTVVTATGADVASFSYDYDELGRQTRQSYHGTAAAGGPDVPASAPVTYTYAYDSAGRLSAFTDARGKRTLTYDANGNRLDYGVGTEPGATRFTYRADDSIAGSVSGTRSRTYRYDDAFGGVTNDGCATYAYDGLDRLLHVTAPANPVTGCAGSDVSYAYDAFDRQVARTSDGATVRLDYDGLGQTVLRQTGAAAGTLHFTVDPVSRVKTARRGAGPTEHLADDGTGSTGLVTKAGVVTCTARYDAYGNPGGNTPAEPTGSCDTGTADSDVFYRGNRKDVATGQYQLGSRTYDPTKAGFLTPDVYRTDDSARNVGIGVDPLTRNTYAYVNGDPVNYVDPSGHEPRPVKEGKRTRWAGNGCATGDCTPEAAARRDAHRREDAMFALRAEEAYRRAHPTPEPSPGVSPVPPPPPPFEFNLPGCDEECERELRAVAEESGCDHACMADIRQTIWDAYFSPLTPEEQEEIAMNNAYSLYTRTGNPSPKVDVIAAKLAEHFGDGPTDCGKSPKYGLPVYCVFNVKRGLPARLGFPVPREADAVTYGHYIFCAEVCEGLLDHEKVHVAQWETYGDAFAVFYVGEAYQNGTLCGNRWEVPAYQKNKPCG